MKKCQYTQSDLLAYLQNRMSIKEESEFQRHLHKCDSCADELRRLRRTITVFKTSLASRKLWWVTTSIACSIAVGIYIIHLEQIEPPPPHQFNYMPPKNYNHCDTLESDSTCLEKDSTYYNIETGKKSGIHYRE